MTATSDARDAPSLPSPGGALDLVAAPSWRRALALLVDAIPVAAVWLLVATAIGGAAAADTPPAPWNALDLLVDFINAHPAATFAIVAALLALLFAWPWAATLIWGSTPGERLLGLRVVDARGDRPHLARATLHCLLRPISLAALGAGALWALADPERRTLHDRLAGVWIAHGPAADRPPPAQRPQESR